VLEMGAGVVMLSPQAARRVAATRPSPAFKLGQ
jgi:hypothetical protein